MFSTKGVSESGGKYIASGIREVKITAIDSKEAEGNSTPAIFITFQEIGSDRTLNIRFAFSENGAQYSLRKIKHIATKFVPEATVDAIDVATVTEYANALRGLILNKELRMKFGGEEIMPNDPSKRSWIKAVVGFPPFAEPLTVNPASTALIFDKDRDIKRLPATVTNPTDTVTRKADLPF